MPVRKDSPLELPNNQDVLPELYRVFHRLTHEDYKISSTILPLAYKQGSTGLL